MRYQPCKCCDESIYPYREYGRGCFRCAVDWVIDLLRLDPNCECRKQEGPFCVKCECNSIREGSFDTPLKAFLAAIPPYKGFVRDLASLTGVTFSKQGDGVLLMGQDRDFGAAELLKHVGTDPLAYDAAIYMLAECIRYDVEVPRPLREWGYWALLGEVKRPKPQKKPSIVFFERNKEIVGFTEGVITATGLPATSSKAELGQSACNAVAEALRLLRLQPDSYTSIRRIWDARHKAIPEPTYRTERPQEFKPRYRRSDPIE